MSSRGVLDAALEAGIKEAEIVQSLEALPDRVVERAEAGDIVLTMGAGTITEAAPLIVEKLREKFGIEALPAGEEIARV